LRRLRPVAYPGVLESSGMPAPTPGGTAGDDAGLRSLQLSDLARRCSDAANHYVRGQPNPGDECCYELFRRAVCDFDQQAWAAVLAQYQGLVLAYVRRHPWAASTSADNDDRVNRTFARFWQAVGPERFALFLDLPALLGYLKTCVHSVIVNEIRARRGHIDVTYDEAPEESGTTEDVAEGVLDELAIGDLWKAVEAELQSEPERVVAHLSFVLDYKPAEIQTRHPEHFPTIGDVYRIKRNIIDRLRRSTQFRDFLS
jgi:DNA-directed RNA polymerase specialized sigma24 family protein